MRPGAEVVARIAAVKLPAQGTQAGTEGPPRAGIRLEGVGV